MKKRWIWIVLPAVVLVGLVTAVRLPRPTVTVKAQVLQPRHVEQTVVCSGVVEAGGSESVLLPFPCIFSEVAVQPGQHVEADTVVAVLDKPATRQLMGADQTALLALAATAERITAPAQGVAVAVKAKAGQPLEVGTPCVTVVPRSALQVRISIREKDLPKLKTGMPVYVAGDGFSRDRYTGVLSEISYTAATSGTGATVEGIVTLDEGQADESLRLGLTAKVSVVVATEENGLVVPYEAVVSDSDGTDYVYVIENGRAVRQSLTVAAQLGEGLLLSDAGLQGRSVVLQPDRITGDGIAVLQEGV